MGRGIKKIFGVGLSKTGTTSLARALDLIGFSTVHYPRPELLLRGDFRIIDEHDAAMDTPVASVFPLLDRAYPQSRFILTLRDPESWVGSMERHYAAMGEIDPNGFMAADRRLIYGTADFHREKLLAAMDSWHAHVRRYFASRPQDLLELDIIGGQGWPELCGFLGVREPAFPFPHANKKAASAKAKGRARPG